MEQNLWLSIGILLFYNCLIEMSKKQEQVSEEGWEIKLQDQPQFLRLKNQENIQHIQKKHIFEHHNSCGGSCTKIPSNTQSFSLCTRYNIKYLKTCLIEDQRLLKEDLLNLIGKFENIVKSQPNMVKINGNVIIIGDIHGQYFDFIKILGMIASKYGDLNTYLENEYLLFLGDYVDRGFYSVEVLVIIMALKLNFPKNVFCLRGNHECRLLTSVYNFKAEVLLKYDQQIYDKFMQMFDYFPFAALINNAYFCVHGGISDKLLNVEKINTLNRFIEIPEEGALCDFMWADPISKEFQSKYQMYQQTEFNNVRMCSIFFGKKLVNKFMKINNMKTIIRAHEVFPEGYQRRDWNQTNKNHPSIITIFSAPNYCNIYGNLGAFLYINNNNFEIRQYKEEPFTKITTSVDVLTWSIPEIARIINQFTKNMLHSLGNKYLKGFIQFRQSSNEERLAFLLQYMKNKQEMSKQGFSDSQKNEKRLQKQQKSTQRSQKGSKSQKVIHQMDAKSIKRKSSKQIDLTKIIL